MRRPSGRLFLRQDAAPAAMGHGWPVAACPHNSAGVRAEPVESRDTYNGYVLGGFNGCSGYISGIYVLPKLWFRSYSESLFPNAEKVTKKACPWRTAFAALRFPRSGPAPWARRHGPSMAHRGSPGIHAGQPTTQNLLSASRWGRQIKIKSQLKNRSKAD